MLRGLSVHIKKTTTRVTKEASIKESQTEVFLCRGVSTRFDDVLSVHRVGRAPTHLSSPIDWQDRQHCLSAGMNEWKVTNRGRTAVHSQRLLLLSFLLCLELLLRFLLGLEKIHLSHPFRTLRPSPQCTHTQTQTHTQPRTQQRTRSDRRIF